MSKLTPHKPPTRWMWHCLIRPLSLTLLISIALLSGQIPSVAHAQTECPSIVKSIQIASAINPSPSQGAQAFHQDKVHLTYVDGQRIVVSSSPDGTGKISSDDLVEIRVQPSGQLFRHDFRNQSHTDIVPIQPPDLSQMFVTGDNSVQLSITDLMGPLYSTWPYYLVVIQPCVTATPTVTAMPTSTTTPQPTATATPSETATSQPKPTATATTAAVTLSPPTATPSTVAMAALALPSPTATHTPAPVLPTPSPPKVTGTGPSQQRHLGFAALAIIGALLMVLWWRSHTPRHVDSLTIESQEPHTVRTVLLQDIRGEITLGRLGKIRLDDDESPELAARIRHEKTEEGMQATWEELDPQGGILEARPLYHLDVEFIGPYQITYHNYQQAALEAASSEGGIWHEIES